MKTINFPLFAVSCTVIAVMAVKIVSSVHHFHTVTLGITQRNQMVETGCVNIYAMRFSRSFGIPQQQWMTACAGCPAEVLSLGMAKTEAGFNPQDTTPFQVP